MGGRVELHGGTVRRAAHLRVGCNLSALAFGGSAGVSALSDWELHTPYMVVRHYLSLSVVARAVRCRSLWPWVVCKHGLLHVLYLCLPVFLWGFVLV